MTPSHHHQQQDEDEDGLAPTTPFITTQSAYHTGHETEDENLSNRDLDDVWGDDGDDGISTSTFAPPLPDSRPPAAVGGGRVQAEVSDIPRLKQEHTTAGYRDGVTVAKAASVQAGFDEGYGLGASIGAHAGRLLGVLTGLIGAVATPTPTPPASSSSSSSPTTTKTPTEKSGSGSEQEAGEREATRLQLLLKMATQELSVLSIFGEDYFARDGTWKYKVEKQVEDESKKANEEEEEEHIVFADIAAAHPLVKKWDRILKQEAQRYGLVWDVLLPEEDDHRDRGEEGKEREKDGGQHKEMDVVTSKDGKGDDGKKSVPVRQSKGALAW